MAGTLVFQPRVVFLTGNKGIGESTEFAEPDPVLSRPHTLGRGIPERRPEPRSSLMAQAFQETSPSQFAHAGMPPCEGWVRRDPR